MEEKQGRDFSKRKPKNRPNGTGTAYKRGKTWTAQIVVGWKIVNDHAQAIYKTKGGFRTKRDALNYCVELRQERQRPETAPTLAEYWNIYKEGELEKLSKSKQCAYNCAWRKLRPLYFLKVSDITVGKCRETVKAATDSFYPARDCKVLLSHLFKLAAADGYANKDIPSFIVLPKLQERERQAFTKDEQTALWKLYESGDRRAAIPLLMIYTGMMPGEAQHLQVKNINLDSGTITGVGMKTEVRKSAPIILPDVLMPLVADLIEHAQPSGYIWVRDEKRWYGDYYAALEAAGCRRLEPYSCRHTTATRLAITAAVAPQTVQKLMRWSTTRMLDRYAHPDESAARDAANTLEK